MDPNRLNHYASVHLTNTIKKVTCFVFIPFAKQKLYHTPQDSGLPLLIPLDPMGQIHISTYV